jgi:DNA-binding SARP family transcriptional activator
MQRRINTLGRALAIIGDRSLDPGAELVFAGVLYLALEGGRPISREGLSALLWPDASRERQGARLRWLLNRLRTLGLPITTSAASVTLPAGSIALDYQSAADLDVEEIGDVLAGYRPSCSPA